MVCVADFVGKSYNVAKTACKICHDSTLVAKCKILIVCSADFSGADFCINPVILENFFCKISHIFRKTAVAFDNVIFGFFKCPLF